MVLVKRVCVATLLASLATYYLVSYPWTISTAPQRSGTAETQERRRRERTSGRPASQGAPAAPAAAAAAAAAATRVSPHPCVGRARAQMGLAPSRRPWRRCAGAPHGSASPAWFGCTTI